jgi:endothelin-converting enzyme/putative endopeptidase
MARALPAAVVAVLVLAACASGAPPPPAAASKGVAAGNAREETASIDPAVSPCDDFYQHACGGWLRSYSIPADEPSYKPVADGIEARNGELLRQILERDARSEGRGPYARELGALYATCMDEAPIEKADARPLDDELARIERVDDGRSFAAELARLHGMAIPAVFALDADADATDATRVVAVVRPELGMPDRAYYLPKAGDAATARVRAAYEAHVAALLALVGDAPEAAKRHAETVLALETSLASASLGGADRNDPNKTHHKLDSVALAALAPGFAWDAYLAELGLAAVSAVDVAEPEFMRALGGALGSRPMEHWRLYLRLRMLEASAPALSSRFVAERFKWKQALTGVAAPQPRWRRCVTIADELMGDALGQAFVDATLGAEGKPRVLGMVHAIEDAMRERLGAAAWIDAPTRAGALEKLARLNRKIAYPDAWQSYDGIGIDRTSYFANRARGYAFGVRQRLARIGQPVARGAWPFTAPTVSAFYLAPGNEIIFPAGILQAPLFAVGQPSAANYGWIGVAIGHEITHGFDNEGRQYDASGNLKDAWSAAAAAEFDRRAQCFVDQYASFVAVDQQHVDGKLTLAENIADNGGLRLAYAAFDRERMASGPKAASDADRRAGDREFFLAYARGWCELAREDYLRVSATTDTHAPSRVRVNGPVSNMKAFADAFACKAGDPMAPFARCEVW